MQAIGCAVEDCGGLAVGVEDEHARDAAERAEWVDQSFRTHHDVDRQLKRPCQFAHLLFFGFDGDCQDNDALAVALPQLSEPRERGATGRTPRRPELYYDHAPL